ncbi:hypothetical protein [Streptomyces sp. XD-27]|uniref:hypothetical protein n=1 Tax=Streptomyces sp. XD-27 TaxID=3062779 RepID=UPI0026F42A68|nr:hypothetical protein [Streptomyces sp. XD-27]WKX68553.1 hypothetical protein Q3Y56_00035 [Streptomyces sp. XD-27]
MTEHVDEVLPAAGRDRLPSLTTLHEAVHRQRRAGRVLDLSRPGYAWVDPAAYDRALAELALLGTIDETGQAPPAVAVPAETHEDAGRVPASPLAEGTRLYVPGAHVVSTRQLGAVTEALAHTFAAHGIVCVYGDPGHGKTVAVHQALRLLPRRIPVHQALVAVKPALPQLLTAFGLPATALTNRTDAADRALLEAFQAGCSVSAGWVFRPPTVCSGSPVLCPGSWSAGRVPGFCPALVMSCRPTSGPGLRAFGLSLPVPPPPPRSICYVPVCVAGAVCYGSGRVGCYVSGWG